MKKFYIQLFLAVAAAVLTPLCLSAQDTDAAKRAAARRAAARAEILRGTVTDDMGPLVGATVYLQNEDERILTGTTVGVQGEYLLEIPPSNQALTIVVGFVGYKTARELYTGQTVYNVKLVSDNQIDAIEVVGETVQTNNMGIAEDDLGTATERIDVTQFEDMSVTSVEDMLQGKLANVDILSSSGDPGSVSTIRIRGTASLTASNAPLIVVDNVPLDTSIDEDFDFGDADVEDFGSLVNIAPSDIQSIEVLKDAAATTLWGPKAANGVLLITTKRGSHNTPPRFYISQKFEMQFDPDPIPLLNGPEYVTLVQDAMWNWIKDGDFASNRVNKLTGQKDILYDQSYVYFDEFNQDTDWLDLVTCDSFKSETDFSMSGGGERTTYRFSANYLTNDGTTKGTDYQRVTSRLNLTYRFSKKFNVSTDFSYAEGTRNQPYWEGGTPGMPDNEGAVARLLAMNKMPNLSPWVLDDYGNPTSEYFVQPADCVQGTTGHPLALVEDSQYRTLDRDIKASFSANYRILPSLQFFSTISYDMQTRRVNKFLPASALDVKWNNNYYNRGYENMFNNSHTYANFRLVWNKDFNGQKLTVSVADQLEMKNSSQYSLTTAGNAGAEVGSPAAGGKIVQMGSGWSKLHRMGLVGQISYNYKDRYTLNFGARLNINSNMSPKNRWRWPNPSISGTWKLHNEKFMKDVKWINEMVIRGSWGRSENNPDMSTVLGTFAVEDDYMDQGATKPNAMQLDDLRPEIVTQTDAGIDLLLFNNRVSVTFDYYNKKTTDVLQQNTQIQSSTGFSTVRRFNSGSILNRGFEVSVSLNNIIRIGKDFKISFTNLNISRNVNKVLEIPSNVIAEKFTLGNGNYSRKLIAGNPLGSIYGFKFEGIYQNYEETLARDANGRLIRDINGDPVPMTIDGTWQQRPGDARYADLNHDGVIDEQDVIYLGNSYPVVTGGGAVRFAYKNLSIRASVHFRLGQSVINGTRHELEKMNGGNNQSKNVLSRWRYEGDQTDVPRALWGTNYNSLGSDKFVEDASFLKIKDITINYRLPDKFVRKIGLARANVFFTAYDLFTFTNYSGQDPEVNVGGGLNAQARDGSKTPRPRRIAFGLSFEF